MKLTKITHQCSSLFDWIYNENANIYNMFYGKISYVLSKLNLKKTKYMISNMIYSQTNNEV